MRERRSAPCAEGEWAGLPVAGGHRDASPRDYLGARPAKSYVCRMRIRTLVAALLAVRTVGAQAPAPVDREFRAVWVATVGNIDWPSKPGLSTWEQQRELLAILDRTVALNMNAVVFHIRPGADAL